jgi:hypothetical protein
LPDDELVEQLARKPFSEKPAIFRQIYDNHINQLMTSESPDSWILRKYQHGMLGQRKAKQVNGSGKLSHSRR